MRRDAGGSWDVEMLVVGGSVRVGPTSDRRRRLVGVAVLVVAVVAALTIPRLLESGVVGQASAVPLPDPPPVGACLNFAHDSVVVVPCAELHIAEVFKAWTADQRPVVTNTDASGASSGWTPYGIDLSPDTDPGQGSIAPCVNGIGGYLGQAGSELDSLWQASPLQVVPQLIGAPPDQSAGDRHWTACVLMAPQGQVFVGTLNGAAVPNHPRPALFASCVWSGSGSVVGVVGCDHDHQIELVGYFNPTLQMVQQGSIEIGVTARQIQGGCEALVRRMTGAADPTYGGRIRISARPLFDSTVSYHDSSGSVAGPVTLPDCFVELVGDGELTGSLIGLKDRDLPLG